QAGAIAFGSETLRFTGVTVDTPKNCTVISEDGVVGNLLTKPLFLHADWMDKDAPAKAFIQFIPQKGAVASFAQFELGGAGCAGIAGKKNFTGSLFGELKAGTNVLLREHEIEFSPTIQTTAGAGLFVGLKPAVVTGTTGFSL